MKMSAFLFLFQVTIACIFPTYWNSFIKTFNILKLYCSLNLHMCSIIILAYKFENCVDRASVFKHDLFLVEIVKVYKQ